MGSCYAKTVLEKAESYLGYEEGPNNWTVFAQELDSVHYFNSNKQNVEWCGTYCYDMIFKACTGDSPDYDNSDRKWDCLFFTYQPSKDNCACGCRYGADYFRAAGAWYNVKDAQPGDVIFFGPRGAETHQGLVRYVEDGRVYTIEGNSSNAVRHKDYSLSYSKISGVGRPRYDGYEPDPAPQPDPEPTPEPTPEPPAPEPTPSAKQYTVRTNSGVGLRLRAQPTTASSQVGYLPEGAVVTPEKIVDGESIGGNTDWAYTEYRGDSGYASCRYLVEISSDYPTKTVHVNTKLNVRTGPGTNYGIKYQLSNGDRVTVYETSGNWSRIGSGEWVCSTYIS